MDRFEVRKIIDECFKNDNKYELLKSISFDDFPGVVNVLWEKMEDAEDSNIYKTKLLSGKIKNGSRRWNHLDIYGMQYIKDLPPAVRKSISYAIIFREKNVEEREKIWKTLGGECGSKSDFFQIWDQLSGDFDFMVINKRTQKNNLEDIIFFGNVVNMRDKDKIDQNDLKCGCDEAWEYAEQRYNHDWNKDL